MLTPEEAAYHDALVGIAQKFGPFDQGSGSIWVGYQSAAQNDKADIGVKCSNCSFHYETPNGMGCKIVSFLVEPEAYCRLAAIPDGKVNVMMGDDEMTEKAEVTKQAPCWDGYVQRGMKPGENGQPVPNCVPATTKAYEGCGCAECLSEDINCSECAACGMLMDKADSVRVGQMVSWNSSGGRAEGKVKRVITQGSYNVPDSDFTISGTPESPAAVIELYRNGEPTGRMVGHKVETLSAKNVNKAEETYTPNAGMKAAARRALKWKEEGKATGAGTPVGWGRATDIVAGRSMSLSTVKRMYSFFSRHEVDKKGKDFNNTSNPSNGRIMWDAWGGDAGFSWSRSIVERNKVNKVWQNSPFVK